MPARFQCRALFKFSVHPFPRRPFQVAEKVFRRHIKCARELYKRVYAGDSFAALQLADRRAVEGRAFREPLLGELGPLAAVLEILAKPLGKLTSAMRSILQIGGRRGDLEAAIWSFLTQAGGPPFDVGGQVADINPDAVDEFDEYLKPWLAHSSLYLRHIHLMYVRQIRKLRLGEPRLLAMPFQIFAKA